MTTDQSIGIAQESTTMQRRTLIGGGLLALLSAPGRVVAQGAHVAPNNPFILLLNGLYQAVNQGPAGNLGLTSVNLSDGSYSKTHIYPVFGMPESREQGTAIGTFYVSLKTFMCAYDLPGGAIAMQFLPGGGFTMLPSDGNGGQFDEGTFELTIVEATGVYSAFKGGHNHMVDRLHQLQAGPPFTGFPQSGYDEFCFCMISQYQFP
jgi:hypothetical protein